MLLCRGVLRGRRSSFLRGMASKDGVKKMDKEENVSASGNNGTFMKQFENYIIVDIGANLTNKKFARDLDSVIQRAKEAGRDNKLI